jgi:dTDP-4-amino-4,6-dideoxygalactose transaminase
MSTGVKVLLVLVGVGVLLLGGCTVLLVAAGRGIEEAVDQTSQERQAAADEADAEAAGSDAVTTGAGGGEGFGSREDPLPFSQPVELEWQTLGDADGSRWSTTIGPFTDITDAVRAENQFNEPPPEGVRFVGFDVELTLLSAGKEPLSPGLNLTWELLGGSTNAAYDIATIDTESFGCGVVPDAFDDFSEVFVGGRSPEPSASPSRPRTSITRKPGSPSTSWTTAEPSSATVEQLHHPHCPRSVQRASSSSLHVGRLRRRCFAHGGRIEGEERGLDRRCDSLDDPILLSGPDVDQTDRAALLRAFDDGWIAPVGPDLNRFEAELADYTGAEACVALSSGTAALHLALLDLGVGPGDEVIVQTATFAASAFAVIHAGATPVFCDIDRDSWTLDPDLLDAFLAEREAQGRVPKAIMPVDLYGSCADYDRLTEIAGHYGTAIVQDAAEALGSSHLGRMAGGLGIPAVVSFNGNKIMTTSGGGALLGPAELVEHARYLSTQARTPAAHYEHTDVGFNYRMSNLLAALGRSQLAGLERKIARRAELNAAYRGHPDLGELGWCPYRTTDRPNHWLSVALLPTDLEPPEVCGLLATEGIEARPAWKPMHLQPVFAANERIGGTVAEDLFDRGLCLPSGSALTDDQVDRVLTALAKILRTRR